MSTRLLVDVHTHVYLPRYANMLRSRSSVPRILERTGALGSKEERLLILDHEPSGGRPVGSQVCNASLFKPLQQGMTCMIRIVLG